MANNAFPATFDAGAVGLEAGNNPAVSNAIDNLALTQDPADLEMVMALQGYWNESDNNRKSGLNPREDKWRENLNLYWNRIDFSKKAEWQSKETMPEVPNYVDRFASAMKEALVALPEGFYTVTDPADEEGDLAEAIQNMTDVLLTTVGRSASGHLLSFDAFFEEQMKLGALISCANTVTWKKDVPYGRVACETVDPRFVWLDHTGRNMYRCRRIEVDRHDLKDMMKQVDKKGNSIWKLGNLESLINSLTLYDMVYKSEMAGHGVFTSSPRAPITLDEYIATVIDNAGNVIAERSLCVVANQKFLIRGPEANPFWHGQDWLVYTPLVPTPLSVYGRTYMEDFGPIAQTYTELTNLLLDAVFASTLKAWAVSPTALLNPEQLTTGLTPNKVFLLEEGINPKEFAQELELGSLPPESIQMWTMLKNELTEAANMNEIGLGQFAPKSRTSATEINATQQNSSAVIRSVAQTVETRWLDINLDLIWKTGLQHAKAGDTRLSAAMGAEMWKGLYTHRKELIKRPFTFQARGISNSIYRAQQLKALLSILQIIGSSQPLMQEFFKELSMEKFLHKIFELSGIDMSKLSMTQREQAMQQAAGPLQQAQQNAQQGGKGNVSEQGKTAMGGLAKMLGGGQGGGQPKGAMT
jgi:hypothetical protein